MSYAASNSFLLHKTYVYFVLHFGYRNDFSINTIESIQNIEVVIPGYNIHEKQIPIKITVLAQYFCSMIILLYILYRRIVKNKILGMKFDILFCRFYCAAM